jgi:hypothetical protein
LEKKGGREEDTSLGYQFDSQREKGFFFVASMSLPSDIPKDLLPWQPVRLSPHGCKNRGFGQNLPVFSSFMFT